MPVYVDEKFIVYPGEDELDLLDVLSGEVTISHLIQTLNFMCIVHLSLK